MRIRSIKPEFWRSDDVTALENWHDRLVFLGLWSYVDDNGVGLDKLAAITADLFAGDVERDPSETFARVSGALARLSERNLITRYEAGGKRYLFITGWKHQRVDNPARPRYPEPEAALTSTSVESREGLATPSRGSRETLAPGTGEQGNRGTEELVLVAPPAPSSDGFAEFYLAYPRKVGKDAARKAWARAARRAPAPVIIAAARRFAADPNLPEKQFIPHPATWLNAGRWEDEPLPPRSGEPPRPPEVDGQEWMRR